MDAIADFGGAGDTLDGGADIDSLSALDSRRDTLLGGAGRDMCLSPNRKVAGCGEGGAVRDIDLSMYTPIRSQAAVLDALNI